MIDKNDEFKKKVIAFLILIFIGIPPLILHFQKHKTVNLGITKPIKKIWAHNFLKKNVATIDSIMKTEKGYILAGSTQSNVFIMEINYDGKQLWYKTLANNYSYTHPICIELKNTFLISYHGLENERLGSKHKYTFEIDKKTHNIINRSSMIFNSFIPYKNGYIASEQGNKIYFINEKRDIEWATQNSKEEVSYGRVNGQPSPKRPRYQISKIIKTDDGNFIAFGNDMKPSNTPWMFKFDHSGKIIWERILGVHNYFFSISTDILQTKDGGYLMVGRGKGYNKGTNLTAWKYDNNGNFMWKKTFSNEHWSAAWKIVASNDDSYIIGGNTGSESWLIKIDTNGNIIWQKSYKSMDKNIFSQRIKAMIQTDDGGYMFAIETNLGVGLIKTDKDANTDETKYKLVSAPDWTKHLK